MTAHKRKKKWHKVCVSKWQPWVKTEWKGEGEPPGKDIRCVVSVAMLTEGWDANNVTQIFGLRAFSSQLLCEQVVGRDCEG